jgi:hypothetical protein
MGLVLVPEFIEWRQPISGGRLRTFPILQRRVCFTELSPAELPQHGERFGHFAIEFDSTTIRELGGIPVFYIPQPDGDPSGNALGVALLSIAADARAVINRVAMLDELLNGSVPVNDRISFRTSFQESPESARSFDIDTARRRR